MGYDWIRLVQPHHALEPAAEARLNRHRRGPHREEPTPRDGPSHARLRGDRRALRLREARLGVAVQIEF
jgi:hypothetical protein